jgi:hypothetical protein
MIRRSVAAICGWRRTERGGYADWPPTRYCAAAAGNSLSRWALPAIALETALVTRTPLRASRSAGAIASRRRSVPYRPSAASMPATTPGTPTVVWPVKLVCSPGPLKVVGVMAAGAVSRKSSALTRPWRLRYSRKPPPPTPQDCGRATPTAKTVAAAASIALPPRSRTARPTRAAAGDSVATTPKRPVTAGRKREPSFATAGAAPKTPERSSTAAAVRRILRVVPAGSGTQAGAEMPAARDLSDGARSGRRDGHRRREQ